MKNTNFFFVNRELLHSRRWLCERFSRGQAWVDLFGLAQHTDGFFRVRGVKINIKRGQLAYSQLTLSKRWKWSRGKVSRFLKELENDGDIIHQTKHQNMDITTIITIVKYDLWQADRTPNETPDGHQTDTRRTHTIRKIRIKKNDFDKSKVDKLPINKKKVMYEEPTIDAETGEMVEQPIKKGRNKVSFSLIKEFKKKAVAEGWETPETDAGDYARLCILLKRYSEDDIKDLFDFYFEGTKPDKFGISLKGSLSTNQINQWKQQN